MRINKEQRDYLLSKNETLVLSSRSCMYRSKTYTYIPITNKERLEMINKINKLLKPSKYEFLILFMLKSIPIIIISILLIYLLAVIY